MKREKVAIGIMVLALLSFNRGGAQTPAPPAYNPTNPQPNLTEEPPSVVVGPDQRVTFRIHAPDANTVTLNGDFLLGAPAVKLARAVMAPGSIPRTLSNQTPTRITSPLTV